MYKSIRKKKKSRNIGKRVLLMFLGLSLISSFMGVLYPIIKMKSYVITDELFPARLKSNGLAKVISEDEGFQYRELTSISNIVKLTNGYYTQIIEYIDYDGNIKKDVILMTKDVEKDKLMDIMTFEEFLEVAEKENYQHEYSDYNINLKLDTKDLHVSQLHYKIYLIERNINTLPSMHKDGIAKAAKEYILENLTNLKEIKYASASNMMELNEKKGLFLQCAVIFAINEFEQEVIESKAFLIVGDQKKSKVLEAVKMEDLDQIIGSDQITAIYNKYGEKTTNIWPS